MNSQPAIIGWDIGGANLKAALLERVSRSGGIVTRCRPFEMQLHSSALPATLVDMGAELGVSASDRHAVTMTAELSQAFRTKREGVGFVLDSFAEAFPQATVWVYTVDGRFVSPVEARRLPLLVAAANWVATANLVAHVVPNCMLIDIGTTSTDLIPIVRGAVAAQGSTDPERLLSGELVYTGALRTPVEAVASNVPLWGGTAGVSADGFALIGDVHLWLGNLCRDDYTCRTPDDRPATREHAGERLARVVCADRDMLNDSDIDAIATALAAAQVRQVADSVERIRSRWPEIRLAVAVGLGDFIAVEAAGSAGLEVRSLTDTLGNAARTAPAAAVGWLLSESMNGR